MNRQNQYNNGETNGIPILVYHKVDCVKDNYTKDPYWINSTRDVNLLDTETKYLDDNGLSSNYVLLRIQSTSNQICIK
jgi:hypothetical protein